MPYDNYKEWLDTVVYLPELNGNGPELAPLFEELLREDEYTSAFEWCAGPAWIGMWLLERGICKHLTTGDINETSVECVQETCKIHNYEVDAYVSDNMEDIPKKHQFDLVVANPPNYFDIQLSHPLGQLRYDLRPSDIGWKIHQAFYETIGSYLTDEARLFISEVAPRNLMVSFCGQIYDLRDEPPIETFERMMSENGLELVQTYPYHIDDVPCEILEIKKTIE